MQDDFLLRQKKKNPRYTWIFLLPVLFVLFFIPLSVNGQSVIEHLEYLARNITRNNHPPATLEEWEKNREALRTQFLKIIDLYPLPEKTPLNIQFVGDKVDLGNCYFQRVVFESRPGIYVAAHLYIPKNVTFPVPAVIHVPGHGRRDRYRIHPRTYAENGFVAIGLPMVGEEGKRGAGWDACGEHGPYVGHFNWFNTGYGAVAPTVWDGIRTVDFLLTLTDSKGVKMVDEHKIGMAGLSGGSARTLWTTIAEPRISCAVVNEGYSAIEGYNSPGGVKNTCDIHLFYNFFGLPYGALYSLIAPRPLLVQLGSEDPLYPNPQPVTDYISGMYKLYGKTDNFDVKIWDQGHGYSDNIWNTENDWMDKWLREGKDPLTIYRDPFETTLTCFPDGEADDMKNTEKVYTVPTPVWTVNNKQDYEAMRTFLMDKMQKEIIKTAFREPDAGLAEIRVDKKDEYLTEEVALKIDNGTLVHKGFFLYKPGGARKTVILISPRDVNESYLQELYEKDYLPRDLNLYCTEVTGTGHNPWEEGVGFVYDRFAMLTGHTRTSLRVNDIIAAAKTLSQKKVVDPAGIYVWGEGKLAVAAMYAAVADSNIAGVVLENVQDKHIGITPVKESHCYTAVFNILKYGDIPQVASLLWPRKIILAGEHKPGYDWTAGVYAMLGASDQFVKMSSSVPEILDQICDRDLVMAGKMVLCE